MEKAVFFDRDGVINREVGDYVYEIRAFDQVGNFRVSETEITVDENQTQKSYFGLILVLVLTVLISGIFFLI